MVVFHQSEVQEHHEVFAYVIITEILERRAHYKPNVSLGGDFFDSKIMIQRFAKQLESFRIAPSRMEGYELKGNKLVKHLNLIFLKLTENHIDCVEYDENTEILNVKKAGTFFKVLKKYQRNFEEKLNELKENLNYSEQDINALYKDVLQESE